MSPQSAQAQFSQDGGKLTGTLAFGNAEQGSAVALSADGNTAIVGGGSDHYETGAAWVFTRSGQAWKQQSGKLVGTGASGNAIQGFSVAISADGHTAIIGGPRDGSSGAAWIFTRSGGVWSQQGGKLVGTGAVGGSEQGISVAISADGNTAIVGGKYDNLGVGAAWIFNRSGGVWKQQGEKLIGAGAVGAAKQGSSVALSANGKTAIVGGLGDNGNTEGSAGAAWVFTFNGRVWNQQGKKLVGTGAVNLPPYGAQQGSAVAISADGATALVSGPGDNSQAGATWVYVLSDGVWKQQGKKLVGTGAVGPAAQGSSVALSSNGNTAIVGGRGDGGLIGATWAFSRSAGVWKQQGEKLIGYGSVGNPVLEGDSVSLSGDGDTALVGGSGDFYEAGATWVFVQPLEVSPYTGIIASGTSGGPFSPSPFAYTLCATSGSVKFAIVGVPIWLTPSSMSGTVTTAGKTITFRTNADTAKLTPGVYTAVLEFENTDNVQKSIPRSVTLTVKAK
jgi:hypothetical protein